MCWAWISIPVPYHMGQACYRLMLRLAVSLLSLHPEFLIWCAQWSHSEFSKIPRSCYKNISRLNKNSQAILKTRESGENKNNFTFTNIEKNILLRLHGDMCQSYWLTESKFESPVTSKRDYTIGFIVLDLRSQIIRCQNYTQNSIVYTTVKNPKIGRQNPQIPSRPPNSQDLGKNPKQLERWMCISLFVVQISALLWHYHLYVVDSAWIWISPERRRRKSVIWRCQSPWNLEGTVSITAFTKCDWLLYMAYPVVLAYGTYCFFRKNGFWEVQYVKSVTWPVKKKILLKLILTLA